MLPSQGAGISSFSKSGISVFFQGEEWSLKPGPYFFLLGPEGLTIREVYALHRDTNEAFLFGVTPVGGKAEGAYEPVELFVPGYQDAWVPVP